jgi:hypothetical protein
MWGGLSEENAQCHGSLIEVWAMLPSRLPCRVLVGGTYLVGNGYRSIAANFGGAVILQ